MDEHDRHHLADLFREDDRLRAENADWLARREALAQKSNGHGALAHQTEENAAVEAPEPEGFNTLQVDALASIWNELSDELRAEWQRDIERLQQRLLQTVARLAVPGERAEETLYALKDRVARVESYAERQIAAVGDQGRDAVNRKRDEIAKLRGDVAELKRVVKERHERSVEIAEVKKQADIGRAALLKRSTANELAVRDARIERLETQMRMLCQFLSVSGIDPPKEL
jgi:hypothetical protein